MISNLLSELKSALSDKVPPSPTETPTVANAELVSKSKGKKLLLSSIKDKINTQVMIYTIELTVIIKALLIVSVGISKLKILVLLSLIL